MPPVPRRRWQGAAAGSPARPSAGDRTRGSGHTRCPGLWAAHQPLSPGARATGSEEIRGRQRPRRATSCRTPGRTLCRQPRSAPSVRGAGLRAGRSAFPPRAPRSLARLPRPRLQRPGLRRCLSGARFFQKRTHFEPCGNQAAPSARPLRSAAVGLLFPSAPETCRRSVWLPDTWPSRPERTQRSAPLPGTDGHAAAPRRDGRAGATRAPSSRPQRRAESGEGARLVRQGRWTAA